MTITLEQTGRRIYVRGNTFPIKDRLRALGAKWDPEARAWWAGTKKRAELEALVAKPSEGSSESRDSQREAPGEDAVVAGRATYKSKTYYIAGRRERGRTRYDDSVEAVTSRDGSRILLHFRDGSRSFWAGRDEVRVVKTYDRPKTIRSLREYAEQRKEQDRSYDAKFVGERGAYQSDFRGSREDRQPPGREMGKAYWLRDRDRRIAVVFTGYQPAAYVRSEDAEDAGNFGVESGWYGTSHYRAATRAEYEELQSSAPREDGVCVEE